MYEEYFGFSDKPFSVPPDSSYLYLSDKHQKALNSLEYSIYNQASLTVITGDIGSGKTTLIRELMRKLEDDITVGMVSNVVNASFTELLQWILYAFELDYRKKGKVDLFETFTDFLIDNYAKNGRTLLIIDEAQNLGIEALEQLRTLSNINVDKHNVLQLILVGQPNLRNILHQPELLQLAQRVEVDYFLEPLNPSETKHYIQHRLRVAGGNENLFNDDTYALICKSTGGVPRLINIVCETALMYAFSDDKHEIDLEIIRQVLEDKKESLSPLTIEGKRKANQQTIREDDAGTDRRHSHERRGIRNDDRERHSGSPGSRQYIADKREASARDQENETQENKKPKRKGLSSIEKLFVNNGEK